MAAREPEFLDPKKQYLIKLVNQVDTVSWLIAQSEYNKALSVMAVLLGRIDIKGEEYKDLKEMKRIMIYDYETLRLTPLEVRIAYSKISDYMNETYFKELSWAQPRFQDNRKLKVDEQ